MHPLPCSFALLLLLLLLLFADAHSENLIEQAILPVDQPFDDNNNTVTGSLDTDTIETEIIAAKYAYLMKLRVKTSGDDDYIETYATPDTGSDLIWLNANDCVGDACHCSSKTMTTKTDQPNCIKKPKQPNLITCEDRKYCKALESLNIKRTCSLGQKGVCVYDVLYPDGVTTHGMLGTGKFSFPSFVDDITFGVSTKSEAEAKGRFEQKSVGVVGLGFGTLSLLKQLSTIDRKFSYCLPNPESSSPNPKSKIKFGNKVATSDKVSTHLLTKQEGGSVCDCEHRYCVHLAAISVDDREDKITVSEKTTKVMVIDSGSTFTSLVNGLFDEFFEKVKHVIGDEHKPEEVKPYANCFEESESAKKLEKVSFEFGGVDGSGTTKIELKQENFFDRHTSVGGKTYLCLTVVDGDKVGDGDKKKLNNHLLGNRAQMDFLVAFDLSKKDKKLVSFDKKKCSDKENLE